MVGEEGRVNDVMLVKAEFESCGVSKSRPDCSLPHRRTSQRGRASLTTATLPPCPPRRSTTDAVDAPHASIIHCLSSHPLHAVCGPPGDKESDVMPPEQTTIIPYCETKLHVCCVPPEHSHKNTQNHLVRSQRSLCRNFHECVWWNT